MVRHSALKSIFTFVLALIAALFIAGISGVAVPAGAHDCGCQTDNSGPGSANSGPGNACHDNSGPGSTTSGSSGSGNSGSDNSGSNSGPGPNSGPGNGDCPMQDPGTPGTGGDSGDNPGTGPMTNNGGDSGTQAGATSTTVLGAQASTGSTQSGGQVPTAVNAGLTDSTGSPSAVPVWIMLVGLAMMAGALVRRRARD